MLHKSREQNLKSAGVYIGQIWTTAFGKKVFYKVVDCTERKAWLQKVSSVQLDNHEVPDVNDGIGNPIQRKLYRDYRNYFFEVEPMLFAYPWAGQETGKYIFVDTGEYAIPA